MNNQKRSGPQVELCDICSGRKNKGDITAKHLHVLCDKCFEEINDSRAVSGRNKGIEEKKDE